MSFEQQAAKAKALTRGYRANYRFNKQIGRTPDLYGNAFYDAQLKRGFDSAYASKKGYSVLKNPVSGQNEMFIRGTATVGEWLQNALEVVPRPLGAVVPSLGLASNASRYARRRYAKKLDYARKQTNSKVVYGHSRGAAVASDMTWRRKVGVDGAFVIADRGRRGFTNYRQSQPFDWLIGRGEKKAVTRRPQSWKPWKRSFHKVYYH